MRSPRGGVYVGRPAGTPPGYAVVLLSWEDIYAGWPGFAALNRVRAITGWPALEVFSTTVEYRGIRVTVRRAGGGRCICPYDPDDASNGPAEAFILSTCPVHGGG